MKRRHRILRRLLTVAVVSSIMGFGTPAAASFLTVATQMASSAIAGARGF